MNYTADPSLSLAQDLWAAERQQAGFDAPGVGGRHWFDSNEYWQSRYWDLCEQIITDQEELANREHDERMREAI